MLTGGDGRDYRRKKAGRYVARKVGQVLWVRLNARRSMSAVDSIGEGTMKSCSSLLLVSALAAALSLVGCAQSGPVEFSATGADSPGLSNADDMDFGPMDHSIAACKAVSQSTAGGRCVKVRAYEACMKTRGYITVLGPENPSGCGQPAWEQDVRKWLQ
jgi:predicted small lipoprotein YifL